MAGGKKGCRGHKHNLLSSGLGTMFGQHISISSGFRNMQSPTNDFSKEMQEYVANLLEQRYGKQVDLQLADSELQLNLTSEELTVCPTLYWSERGAQFVVCKIDNEHFRCQFFYSATEQFGTGDDDYHDIGHDDYDDIEKCVVTLLQVQSDHERQMSDRSSTAATIPSI